MAGAPGEEALSSAPPSPLHKIQGEVQIVNGKTIFKPTRALNLAFLAVCTLCLAIAFDSTSLSVALPVISEALHGSALEAFWASTSFLLASTVLQPTMAALSHLFGRKYLIYVGIILFAAGSLVAALSPNFTVLILGRTIQGIGGGGLLALSEMIVTDLVPLAFRGQWMGLLSVVWAIGTVTGPLIGAGFAQNVNWRWIFYINLPVIGLGTAMIVAFLHQASVPGRMVDKLGRFDWIGSVLFTASSTAFLFGVTTGGVMYAWSSFRVILPLLLGVAGLVAFGFYEVKLAKEPMINKGIFTNWDAIVSYITTVFHGAILWSLLYFVVLYYQGVLFYTPVVSAVAALPETLTVAPAAAVAGIIATQTGHYRWSIWSGWALTTMGCGILYLLGPHTSVLQWIFLNIPVGLGTGILFSAQGLSIQAAVKPELNADAAAFYPFARTFGQSIGIAVSGVIFQNMFRQKLQAIPALAPVAVEYSRDATAVVEIIKAMQPGPARDQLVGAYADALRSIWVTLLAFAGFCFLISLSIRGYSLNQEHVTKQALVDHGAAGSQSEDKDPEIGATGM